MRGRIAFEPYSYQAEFLEHYKEPRRFVLKSRQVGFSQVFAVEALYKAIKVPDATILMVSRSQDLAVNLMRYCYMTYNGLRNAPEMIKSNESEMGFGAGGFVSGEAYSGAKQGSRIKSIPANRSTGRGFAANDAYLDEFAYAEYARDIYQSIGPAVAHGGTLTIGSTPNGVGNLFHELYVSGESFFRQCVPWYECPAYWTETEQALGIPREQAAWYLRERPKYTAQQWASEYECDFVGSGDNVFTQNDIDATEVGAWGDTPPIPGNAYLTSVDIGRRNDATVINTYDLSERPFQRVAHARLEKIPYPVIQSEIEKRYKTYGGRVLIESNGPGDPVIENLTVPADAFVTSAKTKIQAIQALQLLLERKLFKAKWTAQERKELTLYRWNDKALTQDCVMSLVIGASQMVDMVDDLERTPTDSLNPANQSRFNTHGLSGGRWGRSERKSWR